MRVSALFHGSNPGAGNPPRPINYTKSVAMTKMEKELKCEIVITDKPYVRTISPQGLSTRPQEVDREADDVPDQHVDHRAGLQAREQVDAAEHGDDGDDPRRDLAVHSR